MMVVKFPFPLVVPELLDDWHPAYRWDKPSSPYYNLRPDRSVPAIAASPVGGAIRNWFDWHPLLPDIGFPAKVMHSRGLGAPTVAASPTRTTKKASPAASERVGGRPSSAHGRRK